MNQLQKQGGGAAFVSIHLLLFYSLFGCFRGFSHRRGCWWCWYLAVVLHFHQEISKCLTREASVSSFSDWKIDWEQGIGTQFPDSQTDSENQIQISRSVHTWLCGSVHNFFAWAIPMTFICSLGSYGYKVPARHTKHGKIPVLDILTWVLLVPFGWAYHSLSISFYFHNCVHILNV